MSRACGDAGPVCRIHYLFHAFFFHCIPLLIVGNCSTVPFWLLAIVGMVETLWNYRVDDQGILDLPRQSNLFSDIVKSLEKLALGCSFFPTEMSRNVKIDSSPKHRDCERPNTWSNCFLLRMCSPLDIYVSPLHGVCFLPSLIRRAVVLFLTRLPYQHQWSKSSFTFV